MDEARKALENVLKELVEVDWLFTEENPNISRDMRPDFIIKAKKGRKEYVFVVEVKTIGEPRNIASAAGQLQMYRMNMPGYPVFVAPFISSRGREMCKDLGLGFVDLAGNAYLKFDGILIDIWGKGTRKKEKRNQKKIFTTKSTWIIRKMLAEPNRQWKFEDLSEVTGVSLGQIYKTIDRLASEEFAQKKRGSITLSNPNELLDAWSKFYKFDKQKIIGYYCPLPNQELILKALKNVPVDEYALTLGAAASLVAPFVRSSDVFIYYQEDPDILIKSLKLKPVEFGGNVSLVMPKDEGVFFDCQKRKGLSIVSIIQLYLDLYNYPMRGREQAEHLREQVMEV